jgi:hypothetical protein
MIISFAGFEVLTVATVKEYGLYCYVVERNISSPLSKLKSMPGEKPSEAATYPPIYRAHSKLHDITILEDHIEHVLMQSSFRFLIIQVFQHHE